MQLASLLNQAIAALAGVTPTPQLDAEVLLAFVLQKPRSYLLAFPETRLTAEQQAQFSALLAKRATGVPVAYLTGTREFWSLELMVSADTLIPRPETEKIISLLLEQLPANKSQRVLDLGTGSGAIAVAVAHERPGWSVLAVDFSAKALEIAQRNAKNFSLKNIEFLQSDWFSALKPQEFDAIVCNPPYITPLDPHLALGDVRFEPKSALVGGADGLACIRTIVAQARDFMRPKGCLLLEHGHDQGMAVVALMQAARWVNVTDHHDDAGISRVTIGFKS